MPIDDFTRQVSVDKRACNQSAIIRFRIIEQCLERPDLREGDVNDSGIVTYSLPTRNTILSMGFA